MSLFTLLSEYISIVTWGFCLCIGYVLKNIFDKFPNKYIPLFLLILGIFINVIINKQISTTILLSGMISGLSSCGTYDLYKNWKETHLYK